MLRWVAVILVLIIAIYADLRPPGTEPHPFAVTDITPGSVLDGSVYEMRDVPIGLFESIDIETLHETPAPSRVKSGDPLLASMIANEQPTIPSGWLLIETDLPASAVPGLSALIVSIVDEQDHWSVPAVVASVTNVDDFGDAVGSVAVPSDDAARVAAAAGRGETTVVVSSPG